MKNCKECSLPADAPKKQQAEDYPICNSCLSKGWVDDPQEIIIGFNEDPRFQPGIKSPFNP